MKTECISDRKLSVRELLRRDRMEWLAETMCWLSDVRFWEDYCRIEKRTVQQRLNFLWKFMTNRIKQYKV